MFKVRSFSAPRSNCVKGILPKGKYSLKDSGELYFILLKHFVYSRQFYSKSFLLTMKITIYLTNFCYVVCIHYQFRVIFFSSIRSTLMLINLTCYILILTFFTPIFYNSHAAFLFRYFTRLRSILSFPDF